MSQRRAGCSQGSMGWWKLLWHESTSGWMCGRRRFNEMWNSSGVSQRRGGCVDDGGSMICGSCSGVSQRRGGCGRAGNGMRGLLWCESAPGWMWTGGIMGCGSCSGAREDGALPICGLSTFGARFARSGGAAAHGLRAQKKREGRASPPLTVHPQTQMSAPASCPCPRPGAGAS